MSYKEYRARILREVEADLARMPPELKGSVLKALRWAKNRLMRLEGEGHIFSIVKEKDGKYVCAFAKPEWAGDHGGERRETGALAVLGAVLEYEKHL